MKNVKSQKTDLLYFSSLDIVDIFKLDFCYCRLISLLGHAYDVALYTRLMDDRKIKIKDRKNENCPL